MTTSSMSAHPASTRQRRCAIPICQLPRVRYSSESSPVKKRTQDPISPPGHLRQPTNKERGSDLEPPSTDGVIRGGESSVHIDPARVFRAHPHLARHHALLHVYERTAPRFGTEPITVVLHV